MTINECLLQVQNNSTHSFENPNNISTKIDSVIDITAESLELFELNVHNTDKIREMSYVQHLTASDSLPLPLSFTKVWAV